MELLTILLRFSLTFIGSLLFGFERQLSHKPIGFGTFTFVALGACAIGIVSTSGLFVDPPPLLGATVTGIGFLGAGALIRGSDRVFGFTTAASVWLFAIFGLVVGIGELITAGIAYVMLWLTVGFDKYLEHHSIGSYQRKLILRTSTTIGERQLQQYLDKHTKSHRTMSVEVDKEKGSMAITYLVSGSRKELNAMLQAMFKEPWLHSGKVE